MATSEPRFGPFGACRAGGRLPESSQYFLHMRRQPGRDKMFMRSVPGCSSTRSPTKSCARSRRASFSSAMVLGLLLVRLAPIGGAHAADRLDINSWRALAAGATEIKGRADQAQQGCARVFRSTCANVDVPCSDASPVYQLDTEAKVPGNAGRYCWPSLFNFGQAPKE